MMLDDLPWHPEIKDGIKNYWWVADVGNYEIMKPGPDNTQREYYGLYWLYRKDYDGQAIHHDADAHRNPLDALTAQCVVLTITSKVT